MPLGRERPPENPPRDRDRGVAEGVAHAQMTPSPLLTAAPAATRAAKSAARLTAVKLLIAKNIATSLVEAITLL